jgi:hypothetical protein
MSTCSKRRSVTGLNRPAGDFSDGSLSLVVRWCVQSRHAAALAASHSAQGDGERRLLAAAGLGSIRALGSLAPAEPNALATWVDLGASHLQAASSSDAPSRA